MGLPGLFLVTLCTLTRFTSALPQVITDYSDGQYTTVSTSAAATATAASGAPTAATKNGTYQGFHLASYNQDLFLGIPYAQPPLNALRLSVPQSLNTSFSGVKLADAYYPECVGYGGDDIGYEQSEDCLALNVIRPAGYEGQSLPVAVWIHGGGLQMGGTPDKRYNLTFIVQNSVEIGKPIIGVSIAYRLAAWGFLSSLQVTGSGQTNLGLRDQRLALHWIQENIAAFGGDPTKVTIWGESSGATSVGCHLVAYGGRDDKIFRAGIMESGNPVNTFFSDVYFQPRYDMIVNQTGCNTSFDTLNCLRSVPFEQLNVVFNQTGLNGTGGSFTPVLDGDILQKFGSLQLAAGEFVHVPIIDGANTDEGTAFGPRGIQNTSQFLAYLESTNDTTGVALPPSLAQKILAAYPDDPCVGIPMELGCERLNATYGIASPPPVPSPPLTNMGHQFRLRISSHIRLRRRCAIHREPPPHLLHLGQRLCPCLLLPLQRPAQRPRPRNRRHAFPGSRVCV